MLGSKIIKLCYGQDELAIRLQQPGCDGRQVIGFSRYQLHICAPAPCKPCRFTKFIFTGCWLGYEDWENKPYKPLHELPMLTYEAFDVTDDGLIVFRFDEELWRRPPGRYIFTFVYNYGPGQFVPVAELDVDLCNAPTVLDKVVVTELNYTGENCQ